MTPIRNLLSDAVRYGLAAGAVGIAGLASMSAFAQATPAPANTDATKAKNLDRVEVIGSRIKRAVDTEPTSPVTTLTRADIEMTGLTSTFDIINHISASDGSGLSTVTTQTNGSDGTQTVSLRNLGPQRTLLLVDGKRWPADSNGVVDLSTIPVAIIERVEVLKDGASAIYGSDAISGVINIITRKKFDGAQVGWTYGQTTHGDGEQNSEDATIGANSEHSHAVVSISRSEQGTIFAGDRKVSNFSIFGCEAILADLDPTLLKRNPVTKNLEYNGNPEDPHTQAGKCGSGTPEWGRFASAAFGGTMSLNHNPDGTFARGTKPSDFHKFNPLDRYNFAPVNYLQQPATRNNLYAAGNFDITDNVSAYARVSYSQNRSSQQLAQVPTIASSSGSSGPQWVFGVTPNNIFNPFGAQTSLTLFRNVAVGPRHNNNSSSVLGSVVGLQGSFSFAERNFDWEVYGQYNTSDKSKIGNNYVNLFHLKNAFGPSFADGNGLHCGTPGAIILGCVPFDVFNGPGMGLGNSYTRLDDPTKKYTVTAQDVQNMLNYVRYTEVQKNTTRGINYGGTLSGEILPLPGGMLSFAAGVEERRSSAVFSPDSLVSSGGSSDNFTTPTNGQTKADEYYLEVDAPVLKNVPFAKELEFDAAVRRSKYSASGVVNNATTTNNPGNPTTSKFSVRWKPFNDLLLRSTYGQTFRAPSVSDLYSGGSENFPAATDPCNTANFANLPPGGQAQCLAQHVPAGGVVQPNTQIRSIGGGNPLLGPEKGHDFTAGFVWSPSWDMVKGLNITVDYWRIELNNALTLLGGQAVLDRCYGNNGQPQDTAFCVSVPRNAVGQPTGIVTAQFNLARIRQAGVDFGLTYKYETSNWGVFGVKSDSTYTSDSKTAASSTEALGPSTVGEFNFGPEFRWRSNLTFDWTRGDWDANWTFRFMSSQDENFGCNAGNGIDAPGLKSLICNRPMEYSHFSPKGQDPTHALAGLGFNHIGAVVYDDVQVGWKAPWKAHVSIGARNIFGKEPPLVATTFAQSFDASYDLPGGPFYYFQYRQDF